MSYTVEDKSVFLSLFVCVCLSVCRVILLLQQCIISLPMMLEAAVSLLFNHTDIHATSGQASSQVIGLLFGFKTINE